MYAPDSRVPSALPASASVLLPRPRAVRGEGADALPRAPGLGGNVRTCPTEEAELPPSPARDSRDEGNSPWPF